MVEKMTVLSGRRYLQDFPVSMRCTMEKNGISHSDCYRVRKNLEKGGDSIGPGNSSANNHAFLVRFINQVCYS